MCNREGGGVKEEGIRESDLVRYMMILGTEIRRHPILVSKEIASREWDYSASCIVHDPIPMERLTPSRTLSFRRPDREMRSLLVRRARRVPARVH